LSEEKQKTIINAALQCFGKFGYEKASVNDIAVAAHISKASVFQYFGSKKQLYVYLIAYCKKLVTEAFDRTALDAEADMFDRILASSRMKTESMKKQPFMAQFIAGVWEETSPEVSDILKTMMEESSEFRNDLVLRENDAVKFKNPEDARPVFDMLVLMAEGYAARYRNEKEFAFDIVMEEFEKNVAVLRKNFYKEEYLK
ncbi:MAG: TetR/AcrR family transcriptional regulator, partial [Lachnospiraceae bacterium]|nr:TetR/AcrR family transcriptional regulator [Lachnospiraceae bacterium]